MASCNLLLVGRIGNGKSSTGNSILGHKMFKTRSSSASGPTEIVKGESDIYGRNVCVVDGIDIDDNSDKNPKALLDRAEKALLVESNKNVTAFVFVLKYGVRFTKQEKEPVTLIRSIFGENVFKDHGVIVMSHGDNFEMDMEDEGHSFQDWCAAQTGDVKSLFEECRSRVVLLNNKTKEHDVQKRQFEQLMEKVSEIKQHYTEANFSRATEGRRRLIVKSRAPLLKKKSEMFVEGIYEHLDQCDRSSDDIPASIEGLEKIQDDVKKHRQELEIEDDGSGILSDCLTYLTILENKIKSRLSAKRRQKRRQLEIAESKTDIEVRGVRCDVKNMDDSGGQNVWSRLKSVLGKAKDFTKNHPYIITLAVSVLFLYTLYYKRGTKPRDLKRNAGLIYPPFVGMSHSKWPVGKSDDNKYI